MMYSSFATLALLCTSAFAAPTRQRRANPCFVTGSVALPAEVSGGLPALAKAVTCDASTQVDPGIPNVSSGGISFSSIDFRKSSLSPLSFALQTFNTPTDPATADLTSLQNQLNDYLAVEAGARSTGSDLVSTLKVPKFFLQFQIARVNTAKGVQLGAADTVEHQLGKVTKNAPHATADELNQLNALAKAV